MPKSNINDDINATRNLLEEMARNLPVKMGNALQEETSKQTKEGLVEGVKKGTRQVKGVSVDLADKINIDNKEIEKRTSKQVAQSVDNAIRSVESQIKDIEIHPNITFDSNDINYHKIKTELDKIFNKATKGTAKASDNQRFLDLMKTSRDIHSQPASKYYEYEASIAKDFKDYSPKNIVQEFVDASKIVEKQTQIWKITLEYLQQYKGLLDEVAKANRAILPNADGTTSLLVNDDDLTKRSGYRNVSQKSLTEKLKNYNADPSQANFDVLAAYTNALGDAQKAEELFGKRHAELFGKITEYIDQAKSSSEAYASSQEVLVLALQNLGIKSMGKVPFLQLEDLFGQDMKAGIEWLEKTLGIEIPQAIRQTFFAGAQAGNQMESEFEEATEDILSAKDALIKLSTLFSQIKRKDKSAFPDNKNDYEHGYYYSDDEYEKLKQQSVIHNHERINDEIKGIVSQHPTVIKELEAEVDRLESELGEIPRLVAEISKESSIAGVEFKDVAQEAGSLRDIIATLYDEGKTDSKEYVIAQEKINKLLERAIGVYGGRQGSGAKSLSELRSWIFRSWEDETGKDMTPVVDALFGGGSFSLYGENGRPRSMKELASSLLGKSLLDLDQYESLRSVLKYIRDNSLDAADAVHVLAEETEELAREENRVAEESERAQDSMRWIRGETGGANAHQDTYVEALDKFTNQRVRNYVDENGQNQTQVSAYLNLDKLAKELIKHDTEILSLEYRIKNAQGDTSGLEENLSYLKQERAEYETFLDKAIANPYYEVNESQKDILIQQRAINEEMIRNEQYTKDVVAQEKERSRLKAEQRRLYAQMQETSAKQQADKDRANQQILNTLLEEQKAAYKNIYGIKQKIAKLDPTKNSLEIQELERQKIIEVEIYGQKTKAIKAIDEQAHAEAHVNQLYKIRKEALNEIARIKSNRADKVNQSSAANSARNAELSAKEEEKIVQQRAKARRKLQDQANLNVADSHNKKAIEEYKALIKSASEYYDLRKRFTSRDLTADEKLRLDELTVAWEKATLGVDEYSTAVKGSYQYIERLEDIRSAFNGATGDVALKYSQSLRDMQGTLQKIAEGNRYLTKTKTAAEELATEIAELNAHPIDLGAEETIAQLNRIDKGYQRVVNEAQTTSAKLAGQDTIAKLNLQIEEFIQKNSKMGAKFKQEFENLKLRFDVETDPEEIRRIVASLNKLKTEVYEADKAGKSFFANLKNRIRQMSTNFIAMYFSLYDIVRYIRTAATTISELDTALVDLRKTTTMSNAELEEFYFNSSNIAKQTGSTTQEIIAQAAAWSRLGYSSKEASTQMAELSSRFAAISPGMNLEDATDGLVSTMQAFHIAVDDTEREIMDNVNRIGNTFATSNDEIMEMLKRSSAAMNAANNTLEETIALESAAVQITRNAETTGTAFRTISMRIRGKQSLPPYTVMYMLCA